MNNDDDLQTAEEVAEILDQNISSGFSAKALFEEWSRYLGLLMLLGCLYIEVWMDKPLNDIYLWVNAALLAGDRLTDASEKVAKAFKK